MVQDLCLSVGNGAALFHVEAEKGSKKVASKQSKVEWVMPGTSADRIDPTVENKEYWLQNGIYVNRRKQGARNHLQYIS